MNRKIFCTYPFGWLLIVMLIICSLIVDCAAIIALPSSDAWLLFGLSVFLWIIIFLGLKDGYMNFIFANSNVIKHKNETYNWSDIYITMDSYTPKDSRYALYLVYFSNHYLSKEEIKSKDIKHKGFYMALTKKRAHYLFKYYNKKIMITDTYAAHKKLLAIVKTHNESIQS